MTDVHTLIDLASTVLLGCVGFFVTRLVVRQDTHDTRLNNHAQRLAILDGEKEHVA